LILFQGPFPEGKSPHGIAFAFSLKQLRCFSENPIAQSRGYEEADDDWGVCKFRTYATHKISYIAILHRYGICFFARKWIFNFIT